MDKKEVAQILSEIGTALELKDENPFKVRSYYNAARTIETLGQDLDVIIKEGRLTDLPGIGESIAEKIKELCATGKLKYYDEVTKGLPDGLFEMLRIPGLGPKRVKTLWEKLDIKNVGELEYACKENRLLALEGFGEKSQAKILEGVALFRKTQGRYLASVVREEAELLFAAMKKHKDVIRVSIAGSIRRRRETSKDIDILVSTDKSAVRRIGDAFENLPQVAEVTAHGETKVSVILKSNIASDLRLVSDTEYPYALHHFTGSKEHNIAMRGRAQKKFGLKMNEYGLFRGKKNLPCKDEADIFKSLKLAYIEPELREDMGEIEAAEKGALPHLVEEKDVRGLIHIHSKYSDGVESIETLAGACARAGFSYMGLTDHSKAAAYAHGLDEKRVGEQHDEINALNKKLKNFRVLKGTECDVTSSGGLDYPASILKTFDFVIASVHSGFTMGEKEMTARIVKAIENPFTHVLGHPTGRLLLAREAYKVDMEKVIDACASNGVAIEVNAHPQRLDIDWRLIHDAIKKGVKLCIGPDAHGPSEIACVTFGVGIARKGWAEKKDVLNCLEADKFLAALRR